MPLLYMVIERVASESADGLGDDHVDVSGHTLVDHAVEFITLLCVGAADSVVGEDPGEFPFRVAFDVLRVVGDLGFVAGSLFVRVGADKAVCGYTKLRLLGLLDVVSDLPR